MERKRLLMVVVPAVVLAAVAIALVTALSGGGSGKKATTTSASPNRVARMLAGIPQTGYVLGRSSAPVTLLEFADFQCPYCGEWERGTLPTIVEDYVRTGKVKVEFRGMHFVGPDSDTALRAALAAREQGKYWYMIESLYEHQGTENSGWVTDGLLRELGDAIPGLDTQRMLAERDSAAVDAAIRAGDDLAQAGGVTSTPTFFAARKGQTFRRLEITSLTPEGITPALDKLLAG